MMRRSRTNQHQKVQRARAVVNQALGDGARRDAPQATKFVPTTNPPEHVQVRSEAIAVLTMQEAATRLGISRGEVEAMVKRGTVKSLMGLAHGGAPAAVIEQLELIGTADNAERWLRDARKRKVKFMGFGHRIYRVYDPRAKILKEMCRGMNPTFYALASRVEEVALQILHEEHPERPQSTNVEFYSAGVLQAIGLPKEYFTPSFAVSRVAGWSAHVLEQAANNRIIWPQSEFVGPEPRKPVRLADRG